MTGGKHPCFGCEKRAAGCHADCTVYRLYTAWRKRREAARRESEEAEYEIRDRHVVMAIKSRKKWRRK